MDVTGLVAAFLPRTSLLEAQVGVDMFRDLVDFGLGINYFKMITNFITKFELQTKANPDGSIDIVGIDKHGHEIFKFKLDYETHNMMLGQSKISEKAHKVMHKEERARKKG